MPLLGKSFNWGMRMRIGRKAESTQEEALFVDLRQSQCSYLMSSKEDKLVIKEFVR